MNAFFPLPYAQNVSAYLLATVFLALFVLGLSLTSRMRQAGYLLLLTSSVGLSFLAGSVAAVPSQECHNIISPYSHVASCAPTDQVVAWPLILAAALLALFLSHKRDGALPLPLMFLASVVALTYTSNFKEGVERAGAERVGFLQAFLSAPWLFLLVVACLVLWARSEKCLRPLPEQALQSSKRPLTNPGALYSVGRR